MSLTCPKCGLFSPAGALRCDCGYDFVTRDVKPSYLTAHVVQKHGGARPFLQHEARRNMRTGAFLVGLGVVIAGGAYVAAVSETGHAGFKIPLLPIGWGLVRLIRGLVQRSEAARLTE